MKFLRTGVLAAALSTAACGNSNNAGDAGDAGTGLRVVSAAFDGGAAIPPAHANTNCGAGARNASPPLAISNVPSETRSLVVIMEDADAANFVHWVAWDIEPSRTMLPEGVAPNTPGITQGTNDFNTVGYGGPCPVEGETHRYVIRVYAVSRTIGDLTSSATAAEVRGRIADRTLATAELTGTYRR